MPIPISAVSGSDDKKFMLKVKFIVLAVCLGSAAIAGAVKKDDATISSDAMEILNNGARTVFSGHVILEKQSYRLTANRMTREQSTGLVQAEGNVIGTWVNLSGEKTEIR